MQDANDDNNRGTRETPLLPVDRSSSVANSSDDSSTNAAAQTTATTRNQSSDNKSFATSMNISTNKSFAFITSSMAVALVAEDDGVDPQNVLVPTRAKGIRFLFNIVYVVIFALALTEFAMDERLPEQSRTFVKSIKQQVSRSFRTPAAQTRNETTNNNIQDPLEINNKALLAEYLSQLHTSVLGSSRRVGGNILLGGVTVRQIRVHPRSCAFDSLLPSRECFDDVGHGETMMQPFTGSETGLTFEYTAVDYLCFGLLCAQPTSSAIKENEIFYPPSGYKISLFDGDWYNTSKGSTSNDDATDDNNTTINVQVISPALVESGKVFQDFLTPETRFVSVEFAVHCAASNMLAAASLFFEAPSSGGVVPNLDVRIVSMQKDLLGLEIFLTIVAVARLALMCFEFVRSLRVARSKCYGCCYAAAATRNRRKKRTTTTSDSSFLKKLSGSGSNSFAFGKNSHQQAQSSSDNKDESFAFRCVKCSRQSQLTEEVGSCATCHSPLPPLLHSCWRSSLLDPLNALALVQMLFLITSLFMTGSLMAHLNAKAAAALSHAFKVASRVESESSSSSALLHNFLSSSFLQEAQFNDQAIYLLGVTIIVAYVSLFRTACRGQVGSSFIRVFYFGLPPLINFTINFFITFISFALAFYNLKGTSTRAMSQRSISFHTSFRILLGHFSMEEVGFTKVNQLTEQSNFFNFLFCLYFIICVALMLNVFPSVLSVAYARAINTPYYDIEVLSLWLIVKPVLRRYGLIANVNERAVKRSFFEGSSGDDDGGVNGGGGGGNGNNGAADHSGSGSGSFSLAASFEQEQKRSTAFEQLYGPQQQKNDHHEQQREEQRRRQEERVDSFRALEAEVAEQEEELRDLQRHARAMARSSGHTVNALHHRVFELEKCLSRLMTHAPAAVVVGARGGADAGLTAGGEATATKHALL